MKKKSVIAITASAMMALSLAACGGSSSASSSGSGSSSASQASGSSATAAVSSTTGTSASGSGNYKVSFIVKHTDEHFQRVMDGAEAYCKDHPNVSVDIQSPTSSSAYDEQTNMIETALSNSSYDAYVISPLQSDSVATLVASTTKPVIACDTDFESDHKTAFVGTGNEDAAKAGGKAAAEQAIANGADKDNLTAIILTGVQGDETHEARLKGYTEGIEEAGGTVTDVQYCDAVADKAADAMDSMMQKYPDGIDIVCATADDMCMAAARILHDSGSDAYANTVICGFDGNQDSAKAVKSGDLTMTVAQMGFDMGYKSMEAAVDALEGKQVDSFIDSGSKVISKDNVDAYLKYLEDPANNTLE